jgi:hypothetical protein
MFGVTILLVIIVAKVIDYKEAKYEQELEEEAGYEIVDGTEEE